MVDSIRCHDLVSPVSHHILKLSPSQMHMQQHPQFTASLNLLSVGMNRQSDADLTRSQIEQIPDFFVVRQLSEVIRPSTGMGLSAPSRHSGSLSPASLSDYCDVWTPPLDLTYSCATERQTGRVGEAYRSRTCVARVRI